VIREYILPLGTVVKLDEDKQEVIIVGRAQLYKENETMGYFDYAAVMYPHGIVGDSQLMFFNDEDIAEVVFEGYRNEEEIAFAEIYETEIAKTTYPKLSVESVQQSTSES